MHPRVSVEKWTALRQLRERQPPTFARLAGASGLHVATIRDRASVENWAKQHFPRSRIVDAASYAQAAEPMAVAPALLSGNRPELGAFVIAEMRGILADARGGRIDKARVDALLSMIRVAERFESLQTEAGQQEQARSDDELAGILTRVDERIVELARSYAERLVAERLDGAGG